MVANNVEKQSYACYRYNCNMNFHDYFSRINLKKSLRSGIHFEQKTTPDLLWCVALVILDVTKDSYYKAFSDNDVRDSKIFNDVMQDYFSKPPQPEAENEYNKVSSYQLGLLEYAEIIKRISERPRTYRVVSREALEFMAINDLNASKFLTEYTEKLLTDNGLWGAFERFLNSPTQDNYVDAKEKYWTWARTHTGVRTTNPQHSYRVYNKIFNVLAYKHRVPGQYHSRLIEGTCPYSYLIYNRDNFRDQDKPPGISRRAYEETVIRDIDDEGVVSTLLKKAKESMVRKYVDSEITDPELGYQPNSGKHVHHILPVSSYPEFSLTRENLIVLTPGQHLSRAHVRANTHKVDPKYQAICLRVKLKHIMESEHKRENFYNYSSFIALINTLYDWHLDPSIDHQEILRKINQKISEL